MKFKVKPGQAIPQFRHEPGKRPERVVYREGDILEGPVWWADEFRGKVIPLDENDEPLPTAEELLRTQDRGVSRANEKVQYLKSLVARTPALAPQLQSEIERAEREAEEARRFADERQAAKKASKPKDDPRGQRSQRSAEEGPVSVDTKGL